jgi:hypothetical protein
MITLPSMRLHLAASRNDLCQAASASPSSQARDRNAHMISVGVSACTPSNDTASVAPMPSWLSYFLC